MKRSPDYTKKLALDHAAVRELRLGELERINGGGTSTSVFFIGEPVPPPEKKPDDEYELTC